MSCRYCVDGKVTLLNEVVDCLDCQETQDIEPLDRVVIATAVGIDLCVTRRSHDFMAHPVGDRRQWEKADTVEGAVARWLKYWT